MKSVNLLAPLFDQRRTLASRVHRQLIDGTVSIDQGGTSSFYDKGLCLSASVARIRQISQIGAFGHDDALDYRDSMPAVFWRWSA